ncbi:MAG: prolyl oligopeptidase family protein [Phycisphaerales bacterium JB043]
MVCCCRKTGFGALLPAIAIATFVGVQTSSGEQQRYEYPQPERVDHYDEYHGTSVHDPYRWLEDPDSAPTREWIDAENEVTQAYLSSIPEREIIRERLTGLWNYERYGMPSKWGDRYFYSYNSGLQNQSVVMVADSLGGDERQLLDPNSLSEDGTVSLGGWSISDDGRYFAYATSDGGSDWRTWHVRDVTTGEDLPDEIEWSKFSGASWAKDNSGFFYSRYDAPTEGEELEGANYNQKLYFHRLGTGQSEDELVYARPDEPEWGFGGSVTEDGDYLIISVWQGTAPENRVFYKDLVNGGDVVELLPDRDASYNFVGNIGPVLYFQTDLDAPLSKLIAIHTDHPERENWKTIIPEKEETLQGISHVGGHFVASYLKDAQTQVHVYKPDGQFVRNVELPGIGTAFGFGGKADSSETFYSFTSYLYPPTIFRYDVLTGESTMYRTPDIDFDPDQYTTEQVFYSSKDGTRVPMFLTYKKGLERDGQNPTLLYGYGGFNISMRPGFNVANLPWLELGGVYAVANLRGGGEYGEEWHEAGMLHNKQNVFDDFIAAAEYLISEGYTTSPKLAIQGGSNGGLLVGAAMTQRPELFGAALPAVGVMDMLRFNKFTIGWAWESDYGSPEDPEDFEVLRAYSPYHNLEEGVRYPSTMVTTADHDDRVVPAHSFKFAAQLQHAHSGDNPVLIRIETRAGHGAGTPISKRIEQATDRYGFLIRELGIELP